MVQTPRGAGDPLIWKVLGFLGGPVVLDSLLGRPWVACPTDPKTTAAFFTEDARSFLQLKTAVAARLVSVAEPRLALELIRNLQRTEANAEAIGTREAVFLKHIDAMLQEIPWSFGKAAKSTMSPRVRAFDECAVVLTDADLRRLEAGEEVPELKHLKLPLPRKKPKP